MRDRRMLLGTASILALSAAALLLNAPAAEARVTKIQITEKQSPTFGGYVFKDVGAYEKIVGKAYGELDPKDPKNAVIVDIQLAPKNARGNVEYAVRFLHPEADRFEQGRPQGDVRAAQSRRQDARPAQSRRGPATTRAR